MTASSEAKGRHITMVNPQAKHLSTRTATAPTTTPSEVTGRHITMVNPPAIHSLHRAHDNTVSGKRAPHHHGQPTGKKIAH
jgi:hypothetical protein